MTMSYGYGILNKLSSKQGGGAGISVHGREGPVIGSNVMALKADAGFGTERSHTRGMFERQSRNLCDGITFAC